MVTRLLLSDEVHHTGHDAALGAVVSGTVEVRFATDALGTTPWAPLDQSLDFVDVASGATISWSAGELTMAFAPWPGPGPIAPRAYVWAQARDAAGNESEPVLVTARLE